MPSAIPHLPENAMETGRGVIFPWLCDSMGHLAIQHLWAFTTAPSSICSQLWADP